MSRRFGSPMILDLKAGGAGASASVTPGAGAIDTSFTAPTIKSAVGSDNYPLCRGIMVKVALVLDQAASGGSAINSDELHRAIASFNVNVPKIGTTHDRSVFTGPVAKHIAEYFALGYGYCDHSRAQIAAADGDTTVTLYTFLPFTNETLEDPEAFWIWVGWMRDMELTVTIAAATAIAAASTGAVTKAPCTITAWLECYTAPQLILPAISQWNRYTTTAANGQTLALLQNVGLSGNGLVDAEQRVRLAAMLEVMSPLGLGGASTGDLFTSFGCPELHQDQTSNIDGFLTSFRSMVQGRGRPGSLSASIAAHDGAGGLHTMAATPNGSPFSSTLKFIPWRYMPLNGRIEFAPKVHGNLTLNRGFTVAPSSGLHLIITNEIRQLTGGKLNQLQAEAGIPAGTQRVHASSRGLRPSQEFGHGLVVRTRKN